MKMTEQELKVGVLLCDCGRSISKILDFDKLEELTSGLKNVSFVKRNIIKLIICLVSVLIAILILIQLEKKFINNILFFIRIRVKRLKIIDKS